MIYLIDTIGKETGMHLYDEAFVKEFKGVGKDAVVLSNYDEEYALPLLRNFYHGGKWAKLGKMLQSMARLFIFTLQHRRGLYVYQSFGLRYIDILFICILLGCKRVSVVVHDVFEITRSDGNPAGLKYNIQKFCYRHCIKSVICHSQQSVDTLKEIGFEGKIALHPHFRYHFQKTYNVEKIEGKVMDAVVKGKYNFLFFGQLRPTKGVDVLVDAIKRLKDCSDINIIVAGTDKTHMMTNLDVPQNVKKILRRITDEELNYLFTECDAVLLPYKEIYQSGVLETVVHFEKFAVMSCCQAFVNFKKQYPSFGVVYTPNTGATLGECMLTVAGSRHLYSSDDKQRYAAVHDIRDLVNQMSDFFA